MRIDLIITELNTGGAERCLTELALGLHARGHRVRVISLGPPPLKPRDGLLKRLHEAKIPFESLESGSIWLAPFALNRLSRMIRRDPPDVVQTFLFHANVLGTIAAKIAKVEICIGGVRVADPTPWRLRIERWAVAKMQAIVCVSQAVAEFVQQNRLCTATKRPPVVIPNGIDIARWETTYPIDWRRHDIPSDAKVILFVGRLDPQKGLERLFAAAEQVLQADPNAWLVMIGDGPLGDQCKTELEKLPGQRARRIGWQAEIAPYLHACQLLVLTSHYEGMPNVVLEAMACGKPVVCNEVEGAAELLAANLQLQCVPQGDVSGTAKAIATFLEAPELASQIGAENRNHVATHFSLTEMVQKYEQLYLEQLSQSPAGGSGSDR